MDQDYRCPHVLGQEDPHLVTRTSEKVTEDDVMMIRSLNALIYPYAIHVGRDRRFVRVLRFALSSSLSLSTRHVRYHIRTAQGHPERGRCLLLRGTPAVCP